MKSYTETLQEELAHARKRLLGSDEEGRGRIEREIRQIERDISRNIAIEEDIRKTVFLKVTENHEKLCTVLSARKNRRIQTLPFPR